MIRYAWLTYRREMVWLPAALLFFFAIIAWMMRDPGIRFAIARAYLGFFVPLVAGITAAYAILDDPALEIRFATPVSAATTLLTRLGLVLGVAAACALLFELLAVAMGVDFSPLGGVAALQLAWVVPTIVLAALGTAGALATAQPATGAFLAGAVWLVELLMKGWLLSNGPYLYVFMGVLEPADPALLASQGTLGIVATALLALSWGLLHRQERYL